MFYKVLSLFYLHLFPPLAAVSLLGIALKIFAFKLEASCLCCGLSLCSSLKVKTDSVFPPFCHATFHHALILLYIMYPKWGTITIRIYLILVKAM